MRLLEHYTSIQGEGPHAGKLTQFVRFAGCNMRCPGWPCDTPHAIYPELYRGKYLHVSAAELATAVLAEAEKAGAYNVCLTGGEPLLQDNNQLLEFTRLVRSKSVVQAKKDFTWEIFTNGSFKFPGWLISRFNVMMDWKLSGSGEANTQREMRHRNALTLPSTSGVKFVIANYDDLEEAVYVTHTLRAEHCIAKFWVTPAWSRFEPELLITFMKGCGDTQIQEWQLSLQIHKYIWDPERTGV